MIPLAGHARGSPSATRSKPSIRATRKATSKSVPAKLESVTLMSVANLEAVAT